MSQLNEFIALVKTGGMAKQSHFAINITPPALITGYTNDQLKNIMLFCESTTFPGMSIATTPIRTYGELTEAPYDILYENVTFNFYVDRNMMIKKFFDDWILNIYDPLTRHARYYKEYIAPTIEMFQYDQAQNQTYKVVLYEAYPKSVTAMTLDNNSKEIHKLSVSINYKYWRSGEMASTASGVAESPFDYVFSQYASQNTQANDVFGDIFGGVPAVQTINSALGGINGIPTQYLNNFGGFQSTINSAAAQLQAQINKVVPGTFSGVASQNIINKGLGAVTRRIQGILGI
jgi:hypothetical protein